MRAPRRCPSYAQQYNYTLNVGTYLGASASGGAIYEGHSFKQHMGGWRIQIPSQSNRGRVFLPIYGHYQLIIIRLYDGCGGSNERPYGLVRIACGLVRGRHKARPLQLMWIYGLSMVGVFDDCAVVCRRTLMYIMRVYRFDDRGCLLVETSHTGSNRPPF